MVNSPEAFDWDRIESRKGFGSGYTSEEQSKLESMYSETLFVVEEKSVVKGIVVDITDRDVVLNIGYKSDGLVALSANFALYGDISDRMMSLAAGLGPIQEIYSIDESLSGLMVFVVIWWSAVTRFGHASCSGQESPAALESGEPRPLQNWLTILPRPPSANRVFIQRI